MRPIYLARMDKTRPVLLLTRERSHLHMRAVTVATITSSVHGTVNELPVDTANGLDHPCVVNLDDVQTIPRDHLGRLVGYLLPAQEAALHAAMVMTYDLDPG